MERPSPIEEISLAPEIKIQVFRTPEISPGLLLLPSGENPWEVYVGLAQKFWMENFTVFLPSRPLSWEVLAEGFEVLKNFWGGSQEPSKRVSVSLSNGDPFARHSGISKTKTEGHRAFWVWGEGQGALWALKLAHVFPKEISGLILDSLEADDRPEAERYLSQLRKPHLILHPQHDPSFPFTEAERMFILSPAHAKKLLLMPGMKRGETIIRGGDLYVHTLVEFINPRIGRWGRKKKSGH